ncbi:hypothetical protein H7F15_04390 [Pontibacter sp. Tf4]|uniref:hypothetical protein n=1 Tax=Pontibacter sp. Tf4 TaxID=2761620 RepID=UPI0016289403|nr:hypothetical protein [Pontibacter sp. Tf4]MBB6610268.1 hypothetical protein [Pontibacter sp. Tf4]
MFLKLLFGKSIKIEDKKIGELKTRIKRDNPSINYTWTSAKLVASQKKETCFIIEGNSVGPHKQQLNAIYFIVDNLENLVCDVMTKLPEKSAYKDVLQGEWKEELYLSAIYPTDIWHPRFELTFEQLDDKALGYISVMWENGNITEIEVE